VGTDNSASGLLRSFEQQPIQDSTGIDDDRMLEAELRAITLARDQFDLLNDLFGVGAIEQKRILYEGFMSEASAAGLFPGKVLIEKRDFETGRSEPFGAQSSRRSPAHDSKAPQSHRFSSLPSWRVWDEGRRDQLPSIRGDHPGNDGLARMSLIINRAEYITEALCRKRRPAGNRRAC
jgi:hypothetical protein